MEDTITFLNVSQFQNDKQQILEADLNFKNYFGKTQDRVFFLYNFMDDQDPDALKVEVSEATSSFKQGTSCPPPVIYFSLSLSL